jgi:hypothetical protein
MRTAESHRVSCTSLLEFTCTPSDGSPKETVGLPGSVWRHLAALRTSLETLADFPSRPLRKHMQSAITRLDAVIDELLKARLGLPSRIPNTDLLWIGQSLERLVSHRALEVREVSREAASLLSSITAAVVGQSPRGEAGALVAFPLKCDKPAFIEVGAVLAGVAAHG